MTQVLILGAGSAGCAAAIALAERGHDAVLLDRFSETAATKLPETLYPAARESLRALNIEVDDALRAEVGFTSHDGACVLTVRLDETFNSCAYVDRNRLDSQLRSAALDTGVCAIETKVIESVRRCGREFVVTTADRLTFVAPFLIDASGKMQVAASLVGGVLIDEHQFDPRENVFAHFENESGFGLARPTIIRAQDGFFYAIPIRANRISLGWVTYSTLTPKCRETAFLNQIEATPAATFLIAAAKRVTRVIAAKNNATRVIKAAADGAFVTGDALGFHDPFFRDGIGFAIASGQLAGTYCADIIAGVSSPCVLEASYAADLERIEANLLVSTEAEIERVCDRFSPLQILDPHMPNAILAALIRLTPSDRDSARSIFQARRTRAFT